MEAEQRKDEMASGQPEQRAAPRLPVDGHASLLLLRHNASVSCHILDLSVGGCRIEADDPLTVGLDQRVEVSFTVRGLPVRCIGNTRWTDGRRQIGIRFEEMPARRRAELIQMVGELEEARAAQLAADAIAAAPAEAALEVPLMEPEDSDPAHQTAAIEEMPASETGCGQAHSGGIEQTASAGPPSGPAHRERRAQTRYHVDNPASISLVRGGARFPGRIQNLSLNGCCICTFEPISVGIYIRAETEFFLHGFPIRLSGVIQAIHDRRHVGIRFLDVSDRKRRQIEELIAEIQEAELRSAESTESGPGGRA